MLSNNETNIPLINGYQAYFNFLHGVPTGGMINPPKNESSGSFRSCRREYFRLKFNLAD